MAAQGDDQGSRSGSARASGAWREVTIKGFTVIEAPSASRSTGCHGGHRWEHNRDASNTGLEISQNSFARVVNNTIHRCGQNGIFVLGSASAHIGVMSTGDTVAQPNVIADNGGDGIQVLRASTARIIGNTISANHRAGLTVQQVSHADVAGNTFNSNRQYGFGWRVLRGESR
jgi:nitrous oxidase accessory protein NosD